MYIIKHVANTYIIHVQSKLKSHFLLSRGGRLLILMPPRGRSTPRLGTFQTRRILLFYLLFSLYTRNVLNLPNVKLALFTAHTTLFFYASEMLPTEQMFINSYKSVQFPQPVKKNGKKYHTYQEKGALRNRLQYPIGSRRPNTSELLNLPFQRILPPSEIQSCSSLTVYIIFLMLKT